jgi:hypothetical protein
MYIEGDVPYVTGTNNGNNNGWNDWSWIIGLALVGGLFGGWGGNGGFGFGGGRGGYYGGGFVTNDELQMGFFRNDVADKLDGINYGLANGFYETAQQINGVQSTLCQGFSGINQNIVTNGYETRNAITDVGYALKDCCCQTQRAIDGVNYNLATQFGGLNSTLCNLGRDIIDNQNANYRAIHEELVANKLEAKNDRIAELQDKLYRADLRASQAQQSNYITDTIINKLSPCPSPAFIVPNPNCCYDYTVTRNNNCCC